VAVRVKEVPTGPAVGVTDTAAGAGPVVAVLSVVWVLDGCPAPPQAVAATASTNKMIRGGQPPSMDRAL